LGSNEYNSRGNKGKRIDKAKDIKGKLISTLAIIGYIYYIIKENRRG
jgi:hypothetical protein